jgi:hypothetical protein
VAYTYFIGGIYLLESPRRRQITMYKSLILSSLMAGVSARSLIGLYHDAGDPSSCGLLSVDSITGENTTLPRTTVCTGLQSTFPAYSAADVSTGSLFVAISGAVTAFSIDVSSGKSKPLSRLANNASDDLVGAVFIPGAGFLIVTPSGIWNATTPDTLPALVAALDDGWETAVVTSSPDGGSGGAGRVFIADLASNSIRVVDLGAPAGPAKYIKGINKPADLAYDSGILLEEAGYQLSSLSATGGAVKRVTSLPDGPGFPSCNGIVSPGVWFFQDFANSCELRRTPPLPFSTSLI